MRSKDWGRKRTLTPSATWTTRTRANARWEEFCKNPGPIVVGAVQGASCYGPAYEFAMIMDADLRKRRIRDKVPMTFVTAEPYIGHLGVGGVGDTKGVLESEMRQRHIKWIVNAKVDKVDADKMHVTEVDDDGKPKKAHELPFKFSMMIPAFRGIAAVRGIEGLANPRGFIIVDKHQRNPKFRNVFGVGVCIAIAPLEQTAAAGRRAEDRLHDRIDGDGDARSISASSFAARRRRTKPPGTRFALPISAIPASPSWPCRKIRRATSIGRRAAAGCTSPRWRSRNTSCTRSAPARPSLITKRS